MISNSKYWAFVSYSHADRKWGNWLHSALETYKVPKTLAGTARVSGEPVPSRIFPVFRDREELPTSSDLGTMISQALEQSRYLIVICSPRAAGSRWVNQEILDFKRLGREGRILALIVDGEPNVADGKPGYSADAECFPEALKYALGPDGNLDKARPTEPIAADARPGMDGRTNARLKLLAGLLGVNYDDLKRREEHRRRRQQRLVVSVAAALVLAFAALAGAALWQRSLAVRETQVAVAQTKVAEQQKAEAVAATHVAEVQRGIADEKTAEAQAEKEQVETQTAADEEDLGREALLRSDYLSAAQHLVLALQARPADPGVHLLLHAAMTGLQGLSGVLNGGSGGLTRVEVAPRSGDILTVSMDGEAIVWDPRKGAPVATLGRSGNEYNGIHTAAFTPDGRHILFMNNAEAFLEDIDSGNKSAFSVGGDGALFSLALSSDGAKVIGTVGQYDGRNRTTRIVAWNSANGKEISHATIPDTYAVVAAPGSGTRVILVGGPASAAGRRVAVADLATGKATAEIPLATYDDVQVSPRGDLILVNPSAPKTTVVVYSAETGGQVATLSAAGVVATHASWSPSGRYVLSNGGASEALWDASTWKPVHVWRNAVWDATAFDTKESLLASTTGYGTIDIWNLRSGELLGEFNDAICAGGLAGSPSTLFSHLQFSPDSDLLTDTGGGSCATIWNWRHASRGEPVLQSGDPNVLQPIVNSIAFSSDGSRVVTGSADGTATIWSAQTGATLLRLSNKSASRGAQVPMALFVPGGKEAVTGGNFQAAALWNASSGKLLRELDFDKHAVVIGDTVRVAVAPRGDRAATFSSNGWGALWDLKSEKRIAEVHTENGAQVRDVVFAPDGSKFVVTDASGFAFVFDASHGALKHRIGSQGAPLVTAEIASDGSRLVTADASGKITVWNLASGRAVVSVNTADGSPRVNEAHFSPDGSTIAAGCADSKVRTWNSATGQPGLTVAEEALPGALDILPLPPRSMMPPGATTPSGMLQVIYSPNGAFLAGTNETGHVMIWDARTGKQLLHFEGHRGRVTSLAFSPDGSLLGSSSEDGTARIWDVSLETRSLAEIKRLLAGIHQQQPR